MADLDMKLRKIDRVTAPDLWGDIGTRTRNLPEGEGKLPTPPTSSGQRIAAAVVAFAVFAAAAVFAFRAFGDQSQGSSGPPPEPASPVSLWLSAEAVPQGPIELVAVLVSREPVDATFGVAAVVERWDGDRWVPYGDLVMCMDHWHCTARVETSGGSGAVPGIGLGASPGSPGPIERFTTEGLEVGSYRISQVANEGVTAAAILEVRGTAAEPAPLLPVDAPAISVSPALVPTRGAEIGLYPLIPAPSGSQSRGDIERAIAGLSETARIEQWNGSRWRSLGEVQLHQVPEDSLPRSAQLPPLPEGAYRLVRDGTGADHVGQFWVDDVVRSL